MVSYRACQPPSTCCRTAIDDSESPGATTYGFGRTDVPVGRGAAGGAAAFPAGCACTLTTWTVAFAPRCCGSSGAGPPRARPACFPHVGQACGPCPFNTFSATAICCSRVALSARGAYCVPPKARHVVWLNWRPP
ncbi:hypothetical protein V3664_00845 [Streptomyces sp. CS62]